MCLDQQALCHRLFHADQADQTWLLPILLFLKNDEADVNDILFDDSGQVTYGNMLKCQNDSINFHRISKNPDHNLTKSRKGVQNYKRSTATFPKEPQRNFF
jgi:hypothetical protein